MSQNPPPPAPTALVQLQAPALWILIVLQATMAASLFTQTAPHPPTAIPLFAIAPFLGASLSLAAAALAVPPGMANWRSGLAVAAALAALISFGPQKWLDPAIALIWPAVLLGELAAIALILSALPARRRRAA